jgi:hypothetical protein
VIPARRPSPGFHAAARLKRAAARRRRGVRPEVEVQPITPPIDVDEVRAIASAGYPLWEEVRVMQLRNRRITLAYNHLSRELAELIAGPGGRLDANWCTFGAWTSRTVGDWIEADAVPKPLQKLTQLPRFVVNWLVAVTKYLLRRENGFSYRALAAGNRFVFLEIGQAVACFVRAFRGVERDKPDEDAWRAYWDDMRARLDEMAQLDISWLLTDAPAPDDLRLGLRQYYLALFEPDSAERAQLVLAGNMLIGAYEQRRVDGYVAASLALFPGRSLRRLVRQRTGHVGGWRRWPSRLFCRVMTRALVLELPDEQLRVCRLLAPRDGDVELYPPDLRTITLPLAQALITRWDPSGGDPARRGTVKDWTSLDDRMSYIVTMFRSRQQCEALFRPDIFPPDEAAELLAGRLPEAQARAPAA